MLNEEGVFYVKPICRAKRQQTESLAAFDLHPTQ